MAIFGARSDGREEDDPRRHSMAVSAAVVQAAAWVLHGTTGCLHRRYRCRCHRPDQEAEAGLRFAS